MDQAFRSPRPWWAMLYAPVVLVVVGFVVGGDRYYTYLAITAAISFILTASFNLIYGYAGIFTLAHVAVYGIGAYAAALLEIRSHLPFLLATVLGMAICAVAGLVVWLPTRHLEGLFLAIATLGLAVAVQEVMLTWTDVTGGSSGLLGIPYAAVGGIEFTPNTPGFYWLVAVAAFLVWELSVRLTSSGMGRKFLAHRDAPIALTAVGIAPSRVRMIAFVVAGALAGLAGSLYAHAQLFLSSEAFGLDRLILVILAVLIGGAGSQLGPVLGVAVMVVITEAGAQTNGSYTLVVGIAIIVMLGYWQGGVTRLARQLLQRVVPRRVPRVEHPELHLPVPESTGPLQVRGVGIQYGGVRALSDITLTVEPGRVTGLIGPNGAGKTTLVNCVTGYAVPTTGTVEVDGQVLNGVRPERIAGLGVARTFQTPRLLPHVSVVGNVVLGYASQRRATDLGEVLDSPAARADTRRAISDAAGLLRALGADDAMWDEVGSQPYSVQKLAEVARALATGPSFLFLDEPGAGLNESECETLAALIRRLADSGIGILLIDHNVSFVASVADHLHALDGGRTIASGDPSTVLRSAEVEAAYFGGAVR